MEPLEVGRRLLALAQSGLHFTGDEFDRERYRELIELAGALAQWQGQSSQRLQAAWRIEDGYATPKLDVRGAVFRDDQVLLVREMQDGLWSLPGGWADINDTPSRAMAKEIEQETGFTAAVLKLAAVQDRRLHNQPQYLFHVWKLLFVCEITGGELRTSHETTAVGFFPLDALPPLSTGRITRAQIELLHRHHHQRSAATEFD